MTLVQTFSLILNKASSAIKCREKYFISWITEPSQKKRNQILLTQLWNLPLLNPGNWLCRTKRRRTLKFTPLSTPHPPPASAISKKKSRKPQNPEALVQPPRKLLKTPEFEWPGLTFFVVTFRQHCPMNNPTAFSRLRGDDLRTFDYNGKNVALTEATISRKAKKKDNFPLKCLFYQITGDPEPLLLARNN